MSKLTTTAATTLTAVATVNREQDGMSHVPAIRAHLKTLDVAPSVVKNLSRTLKTLAKSGLVEMLDGEVYRPTEAGMNELNAGKGMSMGPDPRTPEQVEQARAAAAAKKAAKKAPAMSAKKATRKPTDAADEPKAKRLFWQVKFVDDLALSDDAQRVGVLPVSAADFAEKVLATNTVNGLGVRFKGLACELHDVDGKVAVVADDAAVMDALSALLAKHGLTA